MCLASCSRAELLLRAHRAAHSQQQLCSSMLDHLAIFHRSLATPCCPAHRRHCLSSLVLCLEVCTHTQASRSSYSSFSTIVYAPQHSHWCYSQRLQKLLPLQRVSSALRAFSCPSIWSSCFASPIPMPFALTQQVSELWVVVLATASFDHMQHCCPQSAAAAESPS